jgi:hypothetical protein
VRESLCKRGLSLVPAKRLRCTPYPKREKRNTDPGKDGKGMESEERLDSLKDRIIRHDASMISKSGVS